MEGFLGEGPVYPTETYVAAGQEEDYRSYNGGAGVVIVSRTPQAGVPLKGHSYTNREAVLLRAGTAP